MIKRALLLLLLTAVWAFGSWWYYTCMIKGFCRTNGEFTTTADSAKTAAATSVVATTATRLSSDEKTETQGAPSTEQVPTQDTEEKPETVENPTSENQKTPATTTGEFIDQDNDAISDEDEGRLGTDPAKDDSDGDGLKDNEELGTDLQNPIDTDKDGIIDALDDDDDDDTLTSAKEKSLGTDPRNADTDNDALNDALEIDSKLGTNPLKADTDNDGISDGTEVGSDSGNPIDTDKDGIIDALDDDDDNDGIPTAIETKINSDPLSQDSDGDGISDGDELGDNPDLPKDSDGDGIIDLIDSDSSGDGPTQTDKATIDPAKDEPTKSPGQSTTAEPTNDNQVTVSKTEASEEDHSTDIPIQKSRLYFPSRSANPGLSKAATKYFKEVADWLNADPSNTVVLTGHTDNVGEAKNNLNLGLKRAVEIKNTLVRLGAKESQIDVASMGETQPIASNKTDSGRRLNRRVELIPALKK